MTKTAQELTDRCKSVASAPKPDYSQPPLITGAEYNQVIGGLRMQLHLLSKQNQRLIEGIQKLRQACEEQEFALLRCTRIAKREAGWADTVENNEAIRCVMSLRYASDSKDVEIGLLKEEIIRGRAKFKQEQSRARKFAKHLRTCNASKGAI